MAVVWDKRIDTARSRNLSEIQIVHTVPPGWFVLTSSGDRLSTSQETRMTVLWPQFIRLCACCFHIPTAIR